MRLAMALLLLTTGGISTTLHAQRNDGFFRAGNDDSYSNRDEVSGVTWDDVNTQDPTQPAPVGCGLLIMTVAGAGYVIMKRKKTSGKVMLMALVMMLTFTQCKKNVETVQPTTNGINMTLYANNGAKTNINGSGEISWSTSETIYVVDDDSKRCVGTLTNGVGGGNAFSGTLDGITTSGVYNFHYYYLGKGNSEVTYPTIGAESFSMDFTNQDGSLSNLEKFHIGVGTEVGVDVTTGEPVYSYATMKSLVSIGYFDIAGMAEVGENVYMYGENLNNKITIDFTTNTVTNTKVDTEHNNNYICLGTVASGATCGKYVMLVPNHTDGTEELDTDITFVSKRTTGTCNDTFPYGIIANRFYCKDGESNKPIEVAEVAYDEGTLRGEFTINGSGKKVRFSQGNLQAIKNGSWPNCIWSFKDNQYDMDADGSVGTDYANRDVVSHFGYGTSGYNNGQTLYNPNTTNGTGTNYLSTDLSGNKDWGYNKITNGGNCENNGWYTLSGNTSSEWVYLLSSRTVDNDLSDGAIYTLAKIASTYKGMIVFPDTYVHPSDVLITGAKYNIKSDYTAIISSIDDWHKMEAAGAVFLPSAGYRGYTTTSIASKGSNGYYWSRTQRMMVFSDASVEPSGTYTAKFYGMAVRLVKDVE